MISPRFKREKYADLIMYILSKTSQKSNYGKTLLCSTLYFIDFNYYELTGKLLTNETYIKSKKGIKPKHFKEVTNDLITRHQLFFRKESYYNRMIHKYYPLIIPDVKFDQKELSIIDYSIDKLSDNNATSITQYAIKDPPIIIAEFGDEIDFRYVFSRNSKYSTLNKYIY